MVEVFIGATAARFGIAHLLEFGTGPRRQKTTGRSTGEMPAFPFMRPAWESGKRGVLRRFIKYLRVDIEKTAKRLAKRQAKAKK